MVDRGLVVQLNHTLVLSCGLSINVMDLKNGFFGHDGVVLLFVHQVQMINEQGRKRRGFDMNVDVF